MTDDRARGVEQLAFAAGALALTAAVVAVYRPALGSYFFTDDFQWLAGARTFDAANLVRLSFRRSLDRTALALAPAPLGARVVQRHRRFTHPRIDSSTSWRLSARTDRRSM